VCIFVLDVCENIYVCVMMRTRGADEREREREMEGGGRDGGRRENTGRLLRRRNNIFLWQTY